MLSGLMISNWPMPILREGWGVETAANPGQLLVEARQHRIEHEKGMPIRRSTARVGNNLILAGYAPSLRRHGNRFAGKSAAGRRSRCGGRGIGRAPGSIAMTLR